MEFAQTVGIIMRTRAWWLLVPLLILALLWQAHASEGDRLLAEQGKKRGPLFPGKDTTCLVPPRPSERTETARELVTEDAVKIKQKALTYLLSNQAADGSW